VADLFKEILPSILHTKKDVLPDEEEAKTYNPFLVNKALSHHIDVIMYANVMNQNFHLDKKTQYQFYINTIRSAKRPFTPWFKAAKESDLEAVKLYFGYSDRHAREALKTLTDSQIDVIRRKTTIGD
jgi:hypothetical protein